MLTSCKMLIFTHNTGYSVVGDHTDAKKINSAGTSCAEKYGGFVPFFSGDVLLPSSLFSPPASCYSHLSGFPYPHPVQQGK